MPDSLEHRFAEFLKSLPDSEWLDSPEFSFPPGIRRADFLLHGRKIIVELKTVTTDQQPKVDRHLDKHLEETGVIVFGTVPSSRLFSDPNESDRFHHKILRDITRNTEEMCRSANEQIAQTSRQLGMDATGLLVILNENISVLDPAVVAYRVCEYLNTKPRSIDYCLLIFESHKVGSAGVRRDQMLAIGACRIVEHLADGYIDQLMQRWAEHNGAEYIRKHTQDLSAIEYHPKPRS